MSMTPAVWQGHVPIEPNSAIVLMAVPVQMCQEVSELVESGSVGVVSRRTGWSLVESGDAEASSCAASNTVQTAAHAHDLAEVGHAVIGPAEDATNAELPMVVPQQKRPGKLQREMEALKQTAEKKADISHVQSLEGVVADLRATMQTLQSGVHSPGRIVKDLICDWKMIILFSGLCFLILMALGYNMQHHPEDALEQRVVLMEKRIHNLEASMESCKASILKFESESGLTTQLLPAPAPQDPRTSNTALTGQVLACCFTVVALHILAMQLHGSKTYSKEEVDQMFIDAWQQMDDSKCWQSLDKAKVEDLSAQVQAAAAQQMPTAVDEKKDSGDKAPAIEEVDEGEVDEEGVEAKDIELVLSQVSSTRGKAVAALRANNNDIVEAIMHLSEA